MNKNWYRISTGQFGYPQPNSGKLGYLTITYEPTVGCPTCRIGLVQHNPFRFSNEPKAKHSQFLGLNWVFDQIFVRESVVSEFEKENVSGIRFTKPVLNKTGEPLETIFQMHVDTILPEGLVDSNLNWEVCQMPTDYKTFRFLEAIGSSLIKGPFCGQLKYNFPQRPNKLRFRESIFQGQPDVVRTKEWFGSGGSANRPILISEKVKMIIERNKWRGAFLEDIELIA